MTRIEGHAKISIQLDASGAVETARFHVTEYRGFETFCEGRPFTEMAAITAAMQRAAGPAPMTRTSTPMNQAIHPVGDRTIAPVIRHPR